MDARTYVAEVGRAISAEMLGFRVRRFHKGAVARLDVSITIRGTVWTLGQMYLAPHEGSLSPADEARRILQEYHRARASTARAAGGAR